jgi:hypothetical protein
MCTPSSSIFESYVYTPLSQTLVGDNLDICKLDSAAKNPDLLHIRLLPSLFYQNISQK